MVTNNDWEKYIIIYFVWPILAVMLADKLEYGIMVTELQNLPQKWTRRPRQPIESGIP